MSAARFEELLAADRPLATVFRVETLASMAIQREWAINLRRRVALEPVAHLLCEVFERLRAVGLLEGGKSCGRLSCRNRTLLDRSDAFIAQCAAFMRITADSIHTRIERLWRFFIIRAGASRLLSIRNRIER
jgi:hypothetical protein